MRDIKGRQLVSRERLNNDKWVYTRYNSKATSILDHSASSIANKHLNNRKLSKSKEIVVNVRML